MSKGMRMISLLVVLALVGGIFADARKDTRVNELHNVADDVFDGSEGISIASSTTSLPLLLAGESTAFSVQQMEDIQVETDTIFQQLLNEEISSTGAVESDNVAFLQKVFEKNGDPQVMNAIIQMMLNEYQFVSAKQFISSLSPDQLAQLDAHLHLKVAFNSFVLSSSTAVSSLQELVNNYATAKLISDEEANWHKGVIALLQRDYDRFFQLSSSFQSTPYKAFASKVSSLKTQIANQSDMPDYYFDALTAVELFNQGYFQVAKVLALSVVAQDKSYILPYQVLAYANFLTNSRDAAVGYFTILSADRKSVV
jgi:hypothetical protein